MILSVSRRTDIPAFYSDWFFRRIREGFLMVRNPTNPHQVSRIRITPDVTDCIVFWTKDPAPMLARLDELEGYDYYFQFTLNGYGFDAEPNLPPPEQRLDTFTELARRIGSERVIWRYDPIMFTPRYTPEWHLDCLRYYAQRLRGHTEKCVFSFVDVYPKKNGASLDRLGHRQLGGEELDRFLRGMCSVAADCGMKLATCAERISLESYGIEHNSCIDAALIERITGSRIKARPDGQREFCGCIKCEDIGTYDTCPHGCVYCYANFRPNTVRERMKEYSPDSPLLCGRVDETCDKITDRPVKSLKLPHEDSIQQLSFFDGGE